MCVVFILISEWIISVKPVQVGDQLPIAVDDWENKGLCEPMVLSTGKGIYV
jgi:hypothetical protein